MIAANAHFVVGTDTGVGKTLISCALVQALRNRGVAAVGMKPVASGAWRDADGCRRSEDADALSAVSAPGHAPSLTNPYLFDAPLAPHVAANMEGRLIDPLHIRSAFARLCADAQHVVVEGVGGFIVPLTDDYTTADLAQDLGVPLVLVVGLRLGCINHALLTAEAIRARGLRLAGWVANCTAGGMLAQDASIAALAARLGAPLLGVVPHLESPDPAVAAAALDLDAILSIS
jgi:dethiobiotin synthetase